MLYLTCTTITSVDLAHYGVSRAKDWVYVDCGINALCSFVETVNEPRENLTKLAKASQPYIFPFPNKKRTFGRDYY